MFYDLSRVLSYNAYFNFLLGERGVGKTYSTKNFVIRRFLKHNEQFIYLRRYKTEIKEAKDTYFNDIQKDYPNTTLETKGYKFKINDKNAGFAIPLSTTNILKSVNFEKVTTIIFDEFIIDKGCYHYLQNEIKTLLEFIETVFRFRDNVRVFFLGNAITETNPYFLYFNISLPYNNTIKTFKNGLILIELMENLEYREKKKLSKFGQLIDNTNYGDYAIDNKFLNDNKNFIEHKTPHSKFSFAFIYENETFGVWTDYKEGKIFLSLNYDKSSPYIFSTTLENHRPNTMLLKSAKNYSCWKRLIDNYKIGNVYFENQKVKNICYELIKLILC